MIKQFDVDSLEWKELTYPACHYKVFALGTVDVWKGDETGLMVGIACSVFVIAGGDRWAWVVNADDYPSGESDTKTNAMESAETIINKLCESGNPPQSNIVAKIGQEPPVMFHYD
jgi:hypothetical protein